MSELLQGWYVDSSPGCGAVTPQKCGNLVPSIGLVGASTLTVPATDVSVLGGRALNTPGVDIPVGSTRTSRAALGLYISMKDVVWFDGHSALYQLSRHADSGTFSMSFWYNPYDDTFSTLLDGGAAAGVVYGSMDGLLSGTTGSGTPYNGAGIFDAAYTTVPPTTQVISANVRSIHAGQTGAYHSFGLTGYGYNATALPGFTTDPVNDMQGWAHIMVAVHAVSGVPNVTIYCNDTAIVTALAPATGTYPELDGNGVPVTDETFPLPFSLSDQTNIQNTDALAKWTIGGTQAWLKINSLPDTGLGLIGAITELWIAPGQYIDWTSSANRKKFHTSDLVGQHFAPVDLGSGGQTPTGTKPLIYCTGTPSQFKINRATGNKFRVFRNSVGGFVGELLDYLKPPL